jgi:microcystin-dependent protein
MKKPNRPIRRAAAWAAVLSCVLPAAAHACNAEPYLASVCTFPMDWCPQGFLPADGRMIQVRDNQALFALIGNRYGGDGQTTFALPDLRGRSAVGIGTGPGLAPVAVAQKLGQQQVTLTAAQAPLPAHTHAATFAATTGTAPVTIPATPGNLQVAAALLVSPAVGTVSGSTVALGAGQNGYLAGMSGTNGVDGVTFTGPYTAQAPGGNAAYLPAEVKVSGAPTIPQTTVQVATITGGSVTVQPAAAAATAPVSTQSPALGMSVCIATSGLFPTRP